MKCIIFDCDGVLVDSEMIATEHFIKHLGDSGYQISAENSIKRFTGKSGPMVYQEISDESGILFSSERINHIQTQVHDALHAEVAAIPGIAKLLDTLIKQDAKFCLASSGNLNKINNSLQATDLMPYFAPEHIFSAEHVKIGKPAPDLFLYAAKKMGYHAKDCIVIEDSMAGIQAAMAAKMRAIGFLAGSHTHYDWYKSRMTAYNIPIANNSSELTEILVQLGFMHE